MNKWIILIALFVAAGCAAICAAVLLLANKQKIVGKSISESDFKEFYYTYSKTVNPPEFQRYRIYIDNGRKMFYHEKREGDSVFLTEEDITVSGEKELTAAQWDEFWQLISGGTVKNRTEDVSTGSSAPWLYLYWNGDKNKCQEFTFEDLEKEVEFEVFCMELKSQ